MLKKVLKLLGILVGLLFFLVVIAIIFFPPDESVVVDYIIENPSNASIKIVRNDTVIAESNSNKILPLASTMKIIVAIEYAYQAAAGEIDVDKNVALNDLDLFYIPGTDGGSHQSWKKSIMHIVENDSISIREIAKGMIKFSSNANTEWLCQKLGLDNVNKRIQKLVIRSHTPIYYIVSALLVGKEKYPNLIGKELAESLRKMDIKDYRLASNLVHQKLLQDSLYRKDYGDLNMEVQKVWSDNLPGSTANEYANLMKKINSKSYFSDSVQVFINEVMEIKNMPSKYDFLDYYGMKGGSTAFVLANALYATDKEGNKTELVYLFNDIGKLDYTILNDFLEAFESKILSSEEFRIDLSQQLKDNSN